MEHVYLHHNTELEFEGVPCVFPSSKEDDYNAYSWACSHKKDEVYCEKVENNFTTIRCGFFSKRSNGGAPMMVVLDEKWMCQIREEEFLRILKTHDYIKGVIKGSFHFVQKKGNSGLALQMKKEECDSNIYKEIVINDKNIKLTKKYLSENYAGQFVFEYKKDYYEVVDKEREKSGYRKAQKDTDKYRTLLGYVDLIYVSKKGNCYLIDNTFANMAEVYISKPTLVEHFLNGGTIEINKDLTVYKVSPRKGYFFYRLREDFVKAIEGLEELKENIETCDVKDIDYFTHHISFECEVENCKHIINATMFKTNNLTKEITQFSAPVSDSSSWYWGDNKLDRVYIFKELSKLGKIPIEDRDRTSYGSIEHVFKARIGNFERMYVVSGSVVGSELWVIPYKM